MTLSRRPPREHNASQRAAINIKKAEAVIPYGLNGSAVYFICYTINVGVSGSDTDIATLSSGTARLTVFKASSFVLFSSLK